MRVTLTRLTSYRGFVRFWTADAVSMAGTHVTTLALQLLAVVTLHASATELGLLNASRWLPYLLFGLVAGVLVDRYRRLPVLVGADLGRAVLLGMIPLLTALDLLGMAGLIAIIACFGLLSLWYDAAHQSFLPQLVPPSRLIAANARLGQTAAVAQTTGPVLAGVLVRIVGAPLAILVDAVSYLVSGVLLATLRTPEVVSRAGAERHLWRELREGLAWVYRHPMLAPMALAGHGWFLFNSMVTTVYVLYAVDQLHLGPLALGVTYAVAGVGGVLGAAISELTERRFGVGPSIIACRLLLPAGYALIPLAGTGNAVVLLAAAQFVFGLTLGIENPLEMGYRQGVTPDRLQGRTNATMRSLNRAAVVVGAPVGGLFADQLGYRPALWIAIAGQAAVGVGLLLSRFRHARSADVALGSAA